MKEDSIEEFEKNVDSKQELLDFSVDKIQHREKPQKALKENSININTADVKALVLLPGIGDKTAEKIISYRELNGGFKTLRELLEVKGIGEAKFKKIEKYIYIEIK